MTTNTTFRCCHCHQEYSVAEEQEFGGHHYCPACLDELTVQCSCCGDRILLEEDYGSENFPLCETCYARYMDSCQIHDYYYKPAPLFHGEGNRYFGVELEIDSAGDSRENAGELLCIGNCNAENIYCKHDGSLDDGFEIVTHPMTLLYHQTQMPWKKVLHRAIEMNYLSHMANTCGLHVHVNRTAFGKTNAEQDAAIARVLYFFEKHWEELLKFSRRTQRQLDRWAARYGYKEQPKEILDHAKKNCHAGRYTCVNLTNQDTIEFRIFRGTLKYNTLIAALQLLNRICDVALCLTDEEMKGMSWTTFCAGISPDQYPELIQYLKERRLYINEPVESDGEI